MAFFHTQQHRRWIYTLQISGLTDRYTSAPGVLAQPIAGHPAGTYYRDLPVMLAESGLSAINENLDLLRSAYDAGSFTVRLASTPNVPGDPRRTFSRSGRRAATASTIVTRTTPAAPDVPIELWVGDDLSGLSYPRLIHVGSETMWATGFDGSQPDPAVADPYRLTITGRGVGGTRIANHVVREEALDYPILTTDEIVYFQSRPAIILAEPADGSEPPACIFRGYIDEAPTVEDDGSVTVTLLPLTAILSQELELTVPAESTPLVHGYHLFSASAGSVFEFHCESPRFSAPVRAQTNVASQALDASAADVAFWNSCFDPDRPFGHPRGGDLYSSTEDPRRYYDVTGTSEDGGIVDETFDLASGPLSVIDVGETLWAREGTETKRARIIGVGDPDEILIWPGDPNDPVDSAFGRINDAADIGTKDGVDGSFVGVYLSGSLEDGVVATLSRNTAPLTTDEDRIGRFVHILDHYSPELESATQSAPLAEAESTAGWPFDRGPAPRAWDGAGALDNLDVGETCWFPFVWSPPHRTLSGYRSEVVANNRDRALWDVARGFYQRGEPAVLVERSIDISEGEVLVRATPPSVGDGPDAFAGRLSREDVNLVYSPVEFVAEVDGIEPVILASGPRAGETVYKLTFTDPDLVPSFGDFSRGGRETGITISARRERDFTSPTDALIWLLINQRNLTEDEVDINSIRRHPAVPWSEPFSLPGVSPNGDLKFQDIINGILRMIRGALVMRGPDHLGRTRLTLVSTGYAAGTDAIETIDAGDWAAEPRPSSTYNREICNRLTIRTHYDPVEEELAVETTFNEKASQATHGRQATEEIDAYGFAPANAPRDLFWAARGIFETFSEARRRWRGRVSTAQGMRLGVGSVVKVTHPNLLDHAGNPVVVAVGTVVARDLRVWDEGCDIEVEGYAVEAVGWNASMQVAEVISAVAVRVEDNAYSDTERLPDSANQRDIDAFAVGDVVTCEPAASHGSAVDRTITAIDDDVVTFNAAHGLSVGDSIIPPGFNAASDVLRQYAYVDSEAGLS